MMTPDVNSIYARWTAPPSEGGYATVERYEVVYTRNGGNSIITDVYDKTEVYLTKLESNSVYELEIFPRGSDGKLGARLYGTTKTTLTLC